MLFKEIKTDQINESATKLIGKDWMLITAGNDSSFNTMTASWGGLGHLWNRDVAFIFVRPQRYTFEFTEREEFFTLSFFSEEYRSSLKVCGTKSGRDTDKVAEAGLTPYTLPNGTIAFKEARLVLVCKKLYVDVLNPKAFLLDDAEIKKIYSASDFHQMYVGEITVAYTR
ncbi:MAG: flavin reductase [Bacteroidales bacterium]